MTRKSVDKRKHQKKAAQKDIVVQKQHQSKLPVPSHSSILAEGLAKSKLSTDSSKNTTDSSIITQCSSSIPQPISGITSLHSSSLPLPIHLQDKKSPSNLKESMRRDLDSPTRKLGELTRNISPLPRSVPQGIPPHPGSPARNLTPSSLILKTSSIPHAATLGISFKRKMSLQNVGKESITGSMTNSQKSFDGLSENAAEKSEAREESGMARQAVKMLYIRFITGLFLSI